MTTANAHLLVDSAHGIYVPQSFAVRYEGWQGITPEDMTILRAGPDNAEYWDTWDSVLQDAFYMLEGRKFYLYHDGDLWAVDPYSMADDELQSFGFEPSI